MIDRPAHLFHGGCHGCTNDISVCPTCQYMTANWSLPDMNPAHKERENEGNRARKRAWDAYNAKNNPEKKKVSHLKVLKNSDVERSDGTTNKKRKLCGLLPWINQTSPTGLTRRKKMKIYKIEIGDSTCFGEESLAFVSYLDGLGHDVKMTNSGGNYIDGFRVEDGDCPVDLNQLWIGYCNS